MRSIVERLASTTGRAILAHDRSPPQSEEFLRRLLKHLPGMAYRCRNDADWTMEFVSQGCRALTGFAPEDLIENRVVSFGDLIHPDDRMLRPQIRLDTGAGREKRDPFFRKERVTRKIELRVVAVDVH